MTKRGILNNFHGWRWKDKRTISIHNNIIIIIISMLIISRTIVRWFEFYDFLAIFIQMNEFMQHMPYNEECLLLAKLNLHLKRISSRYQGTSYRISSNLSLFKFVSFNKLLFCLSLTFCRACMHKIITFILNLLLDKNMIDDDSKSTSML